MSAVAGPHLKAAVLTRLGEAEAAAAQARREMVCAEHRPFHLGLRHAREKAAAAEEHLAQVECEYRLIFGSDRVPHLAAA